MPLPGETQEEWKERVRSIGAVLQFKPGAKKKRAVENEERGGRAGYHVEHYDGSQDAVAQPRAIQLKMTTKGDHDG